MATRIFIPPNFTVSAINRFTRGIVGAAGTPNDSEFTFDFGPLNFIDGTGYTVLSNTLEWLISDGVTVRFSNFDNLRRPAIVYLDDCGFFRDYAGIRLREQAQVRETTLPCTAVAHAHAHGWLENTFSPWMSSVLDVGHASLASIRTCVKELFHNINDHSTKDTGFVHVQHYPNNRQIRITVSDFGTGIPSNIRAKFGPMNDGAAIRLACEEGVTTQSTPNNMGAGLSYLTDIVVANGGTVSFHSFSGSLNCFRGKNGLLERRSFIGNGTYPGTLVDIILDTRLFIGDDDERVEVEW